LPSELQRQKGEKQMQEPNEDLEIQKLLDAVSLKASKLNIDKRSKQAKEGKKKINKNPPTAYFISTPDFFD
jgi:hypothetical protein